jgi:hypothetical protein
MNIILIMQTLILLQIYFGALHFSNLSFFPLLLGQHCALCSLETNRWQNKIYARILYEYIVDPVLPTPVNRL